MTFKWESYKRAIEHEFTIIDKNKKEVPFVLNRAQNHFGANLTERNTILKARKLGFSSLVLGIGVVKFLFGENERVVSMSFDQDASGKQLERAKHFIRSFEIRNGIKLNPKYNSKTEMVYEGVSKKTGRPYTNTLRIGTAKSDSYGRGDDITFLHITEVAMCTNLPQLLAGVTQAVVNDSIVTFETTANGFNAFRDFWISSERGETGFTPFFYGPDWEYDQAFLDQKKRELKELYDQEYPESPQVAFRTSGESFFDTQALRLFLDVAKDPMQGGIYL